MCVCMYARYSASSLAGQAALAKKRSLEVPPSWQGEPPPAAATAATTATATADDNMKGKGLVNASDDFDESLFGDPPLSVDDARVDNARVDDARNDAARDDADDDDFLADLRAAPCEDPVEEAVVFIVLFSFVLFLFLFWF